MLSKNKTRLDQILISRNLAKDQREALALIMAGRVYSDNKLLSKPGMLVKNDLHIIVKRSKPHDYVSRAALKLIHGLEYFNINPDNMIAADLGCAIGGFTQVLLQRNIRKIYSVDVGYGEFDWNLRQDKKVILLERTNARYLTPELICDQLDLIVCDASFIRLSTILPATLKLAGKGAILIALIKPQFEVKKDQVGAGGIITDETLHLEVIAKVSAWITSQNWRILGVTDSPIKGTEGNKEFLIGAINETN
jgi:23S rRNA (cytidine1920-2'-O)/16S rRNA (cytidine1409-2'-O)-methyltransferase